MNPSYAHMHDEYAETKRQQGTLLGVPKMEMFESPASWICRAALSQGATRDEFARFLGLRKHDDPDLAFTPNAIEEIARRCGLPKVHFEFASHMFSGLASIDPEGKRFLSDYKRAARYRYCPACLYESRVKHFMVHWRFSAWRYCPEHDCRMEETCKRCAAHIELPTDMLLGGPDRRGIATLDYCMVCGHRLSAHWKEVRGEMRRLDLNYGEKLAFAYGRATLAAVYHRRVKYVENALVHTVGLKYLLQLDDLGRIPNKDSDCSGFAHYGDRYRNSLYDD